LDTPLFWLFCGGKFFLACKFDPDGGYFYFCWKEKFVQGYLSKTELLAEAAQLKERLGSAASPVVFSHNDALLANIVYQQEKEQV
jgi:hypothetical protein